MDAFQIIEKKKNGKKLSKKEIESFISGVSSKVWHDYQISALLMAIAIRGMDREETSFLTRCMLESGQQRPKNSVIPVIDKHSTGGVGDKTSFIIGSIVSTFGIQVPMVAGRSLGHTGGTIDKIESIPGFKTSLSPNEFESILKEHQFVLSGQTSEIAPADKKLYALRDVTATIDSIPLITASIMSKKLSEGLDGLVMDIKFGDGAFLQEKSQGLELAKSIMSTAEDFGVRCLCYSTNMDQPLGEFAGNALEMKECIDVLKGKGHEDLKALCLHLSAGMIYLGGKAKTYDEGLFKAEQAIDDGSALEKFRHFLQAQGASTDVIDDESGLCIAPQQTTVKANKQGHLSRFRTKQTGELLIKMGAGRKVQGQELDLSVGLQFHKKLGDEIKVGDPLITIYHHSHQSKQVLEWSEEIEKEILSISPTAVQAPELIHQILQHKEEENVREALYSCPVYTI